MVEQCCTVLYTDTMTPEAAACGGAVVYCIVRTLVRGLKQQHVLQQCFTGLYIDTTRPKAAAWGTAVLCCTVY